MKGFTPRQQLGLVLLLGLILLSRSVLFLDRPGSPPSATGPTAQIQARDGREPSQGELFLLGRPLDLNRASGQDLTLLPRIGPRRAALILGARTQKGGFASLEEMLEIPGLGPHTVRELRPYVSCGSPAGP